VLVVTSRHRLVERVGAMAGDWPDVLLAQIAGALEGGADLIQVREPDLDAGALARFLRRLFREVPGSHSRVLVNDRADVAWVTGAAGVHLTERSLDLEDVRRLLPADKKWVTGRSVHDPATAARCRSASYLLAGTVRTSGSKPPDWGLLGWDGLTAVVLAAADTPVVAIGGLGAGDVPAIRRTGARGLAGIGWFLPESGREIGASVQDRVHAVRRAFDTLGDETYTRRSGGSPDNSG
jgi:thiamine-phosphate pyrophosphorylase